MHKREPGNSSLDVSALGFGYMGVSYGYGPTGNKQGMVPVIRSAVGRGVSEDTECQGSFAYMISEVLKTSGLKMRLPSSPAPAKSACALKRQV